MSNSAKQFKFVSPGIQLAEIDNSQLPNTADKIGPVVIGRAERGPGRPVTVDSPTEYATIFGNPIPGTQGGDIWREGSFKTAPAYGTYASYAWLLNNTPLTFVRLLGYSHTNATTAGQAGWETKDASGNSNGLGTADSAGGAYGLFLIPSSSYSVLTGSDSTPQTGTLAAVWYFNEGSIVLSGTFRDGTIGTGSAVIIKSVGSDYEFKALIYDRDSNVVKTSNFNFNSDSQKYIRKVFNTNPSLCNTNTALGANTASYWLGGTYERNITDVVGAISSSAGSVFGIILGLQADTSATEGCDFRMDAQPSKTGWFFSQDLNIVNAAINTFQPEKMTKLFRIWDLETGEWAGRNLKISVQDIKASTNPSDPYGVFTVVVRKASDSDNAPIILEQFSSCTLNPNSNDYIAKKIGDKYTTWDDTERRYREYGNYNNQSRFIRVEMNADVDAGAINPTLLPFGVYGPPRFKGFALGNIGTSPLSYGGSTVAGGYYAKAFVKGKGSIDRTNVPGTWFMNGTGSAFTGSFKFPAPCLRSSSFGGGLANPTEVYWGLDTSISTTSTRFDPGYVDMVRPLPSGFDSYDADYTYTEYSWIFTLDDLSGSAANVTYLSGSRASGKSITASGSYESVLSAKYDRFTSPMFGGFDGLDVLEKEPFCNRVLNASTSELTNYAYNSVKRAIDSIADPEVVEGNILTVPGVTQEALTSHVLTVSQNRGDMLGIIDLKGGFQPNTENNYGDSSATNSGDVDTVISNLRARGINNSYGCAYYPWVQVRDTINDTILWVPQSVVALGVMASSEKNSELWFAPAGFNRGGLSEGAAGLPVIGVRQKLTSKERDKLYEANINPIASFPSNGIVIFGQKTLQVTQSALDRINVRRMLIYVKKEISRFAKSILFDSNNKVTWNRFIGKAEPFLRSVKIRFGLSDYKLVLDETTTTPDLIDRNILYAKIFLKPERAIEYIGIDFNITSTGASFTD